MYMFGSRTCSFFFFFFFLGTSFLRCTSSSSFGGWVSRVVDACACARVCGVGLFLLVVRKLLVCQKGVRLFFSADFAQSAGLSGGSSIFFVFAVDFPQTAGLSVRTEFDFFVFFCCIRANCGSVRKEFFFFCCWSVKRE